jgi:hypothetical protein
LRAALASAIPPLLALDGDRPRGRIASTAGGSEEHGHGWLFPSVCAELNARGDAIAATTRANGCSPFLLQGSYVLRTNDAICAAIY